MIDFSEDNWDIEEDLYDTLLDYVGEDIKLLKGLVGERVKMVNKKYLNQSINHITKQQQIGIIVGVNDYLLIINKNKSHLIVKWGENDFSYGYKLEDVELY